MYRRALGLTLGVTCLVLPGVVPPPTALGAASGTCHGNPATIVGTPGPDRLIGTPGRDVILGLQGKDVIRGLGGTDVICGGAGNDLIGGGPGADFIYPSPKKADSRDHDVVYGGPDSDNVTAYDEFGVIHLGDGPDKAHLLGGRPVVTGNAGDDRISFRLRADSVSVKGAAPQVQGGRGQDVLNLDATGVATAKPSTFLVDRRFDELVYSHDLAHAVAFGTVRGINSYRLFQYDPTRVVNWKFVGSPHAEQVEVVDDGRLVADTRGGRDSLVGGPGDDRLDGGAGVDFADGRGGVNTCLHVESGPC